MTILLILLNLGCASSSILLNLYLHQCKERSGTHSFCNQKAACSQCTNVRQTHLLKTPAQVMVLDPQVKEKYHVMIRAIAEVFGSVYGAHHRCIKLGSRMVASLNIEWFPNCESCMLTDVTMI